MFGLLILGFWIAVLGGGFYLARRLIVAFERKSGGNSDETRELRERVGALEETIESMRRDMDRIDSGMEFTTKLLEGRVGKTPPSDTRP